MTVHWHAMTTHSQAMTVPSRTMTAYPAAKGVPPHSPPSRTPAPREGGRRRHAAGVVTTFPRLARPGTPVTVRFAESFPWLAAMLTLAPLLLKGRSEGGLVP